MNDVVTGSETEGSLHVVTGSKDRSLRLYKVVVPFYLSCPVCSIVIFFLYPTLCLGLLKCDTSVSMDYPKRVGAYKILRGHTASVKSISVDPSGDMVMITVSRLLHQCYCYFYLLYPHFLLTFSLGT